MSKHVYHHYVPRFYLKKWTTNNCLTRFQWVRGKFEVRQVSTARIAGQDHLYALRNERKDPQFFERELMGPRIDDPAAQVYQHLINKAPLTETQRIIWIRFLMSLRVRTPDMIDLIRLNAESELRRQLMDQSKEYDSMRGSDDPGNLYEWIEFHQPGFVADFGIRILPDILNHKPTVKKIFQMYWWTQHFDEATVDLLISDRPLSVTGK